MSTTRLPELPPTKDEPMLRDHPYYGAAEVHAYGLAVWKAAMEEAATAVNTKFLQPRSMSHAEAVHNIAVRECLDAIRSLPLPEQGGPQ